jgi:uncharacterized protein
LKRQVRRCERPWWACAEGSPRSACAISSAPAGSTRSSAGRRAPVRTTNLRSPADVDAVLEEGRAAGAEIVREPGETFWGGYSAVFIDPEGHPWEIAHNPRWTLTADGGVRLG